MNFRTGKEGCARETQEGFPAPFKSKVFRTLSSENLRSGEKSLFRYAGWDTPCPILFLSVTGTGDRRQAIYWCVRKEAELMFRGGRNCVIGMFAIAMGCGILIAAIFPTGMLMFLVATLLIASGCACWRR